MADEAQLRDYLRRVTVELAEERGRLHALRHEPIAIVGMACRYPGGVASPAALWELVAAGSDAIEPFPADRGWDLKGLYEPDPEGVGAGYAREGGFVEGATGFDAEFFGINRLEALAMDPQQRLLLEVAWEALEDAGIDPTGLRGEQAGVFAGLMYQEYGSLEGGISPGITGSLVSGRVAYALGLEGPAMTIDTACSSSLVAMHLAAQALRVGECSLALAGGVSVLSTSAIFTQFFRQRGLSPDGRCHSYAEGANGTGFSEGVGVLALERLADAEANGHPVLATIRGTAVNQDGASNGLTAPNRPAQERVIRESLANARLTPADIEMIEGHGTGTTLGDPIEASALIATYGQDREAPLRLGSLKSNIGHAAAAAGVGGVIKAVLAMREGVMPKTLHVDEPSSKVDWEAGRIELLTEAAEWEANGRPRRAAVSSFGASGTNAHLILEQGPEPEPVEAQEGEAPTPPLTGPVPLALSAKSEQALRESAARLATHLREHPEQELLDTAYSLARTRSAFEHRAVAVGTEREQLLDSLQAIASGAPGEGASGAPYAVIDHIRRTATERRPVFAFGGQGSQHPQMALGLTQASPVFARSIAECEAALAPHVDWSLTEVLEEEEGKWMERLDIVQPALFATMVSLARLWEASGVRPSLVIGHSQGEVAAAHVAGALCLEDAARVIALRSAAMAKIAGKGAMASVSLPLAELEELLAPYGERLSLAAANGPRTQAVSGEPEAIAELLGACEEQGVRARRIAVDYAAHSAQIEQLEEELLEAFAPISPQSSEIPLHSTLTGELLDTARMDASYWYRNLRETVLFEPVIEALLEQGRSHFIEISPHPVLSFGIAEAIEASESPARVLDTLRRDEDPATRFCLSLAEAHAAGAQVEWEDFFAGSGARKVPLPTYPFQRKRYWLSPGGASGDPSSLGLADAEHPLLGAALSVASGEELLFTGRISLATHPWLADHAVAGTVLFPGTAFLELALAAAERLGAEQVAELTLQAPLVLPETGAVQIQVAVGGADEAGRREIRIDSRTDAAAAQEAEWTLNADGALLAEPVAPVESLGAWPPEGAEPLDAELLYDRLAEAGFEYGPAFQGLTRAWRKGEEVFADVALGEEQAAKAQEYALHPALFDAALHGAVLAGLSETGIEGTRLPFAWQGVGLEVSGARALRVRISLRGEQIGLALADAEGAPVASVGSLLARPVSPEQLRAARRGGGLLGVEWSARRLAPAADRSVAKIWRHRPEGDSGPATARRAVAAALEAIQTSLAGAAEAPEQRLAIVTEGAMATFAGESPDPAAAAIWGLVRSAQSEHPGHFLLVDSDGSEASEAALDAVVAQTEEPQVALREGTALVPRATRLPVGDGNAALDPAKTVLITGATGTLGGLAAKHLLTAHGARHLLLVSRSGPEAPGAAELRAELEEQGAEVEIAACDVAERGALEALLAAIPAERPLGAVFHAAGALDDATIESLTAERLDPVFAPKADAAWALHELTAEAELTHFVCFSSAAGTLGGPGQGNYAAANAYLDALAQRRRAAGLPATSIAWGYWETESELTAKLTEADLERMRRGGIAPLADAEALPLLDQALGAERPDVLAVALEPSGLRQMASLGVLPPLLCELIRVPKRRAGAGGSLARKLAEMPEAQREAHVLEVVRGEAAAVLGHDSAGEIAPDRPLGELGLGSLAALELRSRLGAATGLSLAATVAFDHPTVERLAAHLLAEVMAGGAARVTTAARVSDEPIAIVGMSCRLPGGVASPEELWELLAEGRDAIEPFPADRGWDLERLYDPEPGAPDAIYTRQGGFLPDVADFDAEFFRVSPREALETDPQQRQLLEGAWEALEDAGIDPLALRGTPAGVFAGVMYQDYGVAPGMTTSVVSGRLAYTLGLEGPAMTIDTACSSSLVAVHLAAQALHAGECGLAIAGGVTVLATPSSFIEFSRQRGLATDGRCKPFAEAADGTGFSEGLGVLVLERLSDAEANGHRVLATIRGSAVNQDGATSGFTAPNGPSQERVIRQALANARLKSADVDMVEAHGTGTTLGDPIEAGALLATYGQDREAPLKLGSVKSNIGHTAAAAGVAGVIKSILAMREGVMPKTLHVDAPSTKVEWEAGQVELLTEAAEWEAREGRPRRAAVSSFGASGTNAHLILEQGPARVEAEEGEGRTESLNGPLPLALSAKSGDALRESAARLKEHLQDNPEQDLLDTAHSLLTARSAFPHRAVAVGAERQQLLDSLQAIAEGRPSSSSATATANPGRLAYLLSGQGSQRPGMGKELHETYPAYAEALEEALAELDPHLELSLRDLLFAEPGSPEAELLGDTTYAQPALFATHVALHRLLESWGLAPELLAGHSVGEISAAQIAGVLSLPDAARLICARGALMGALPSGGAMLAVQASEPEVAEAIEGLQAELSIAALNSPTSTVISGDGQAIEAQQSLWEERGRKTKRLQVSHAFHSPLIEPMMEAFAEVAASLSYAEPQVPIVSNLTGEVLSAGQATDPAYWVSHVRSPVRFADSVGTLIAQGATALVELGPDPVLTAMAAECVEDAEKPPALIPTLREGRPEPETATLALGAAHAAGAKVRWQSFFGGTEPKRAPLPTYPFQRKRYWLSPGGASGDPSSLGLAEAGHPLLGAAIEDPSGDTLTLTGRISLATHAWLLDHVVTGAAIFPSSGFLELALHAVELVGAEQVRELTMQVPLVLTAESAVQIRVSVGAAGKDGDRQLAIHGRVEGREWTLHAEGALSMAPSDTSPESLGEWPPTGAEALETEFLYDRLAEAGFEYGPAFQGLTRAWRRGEAVFAEVSLAEEQMVEADRYGVHPALFDSVLHAALLAELSSGGASAQLRLPFAWSGVSLHAAGARELRVRIDIDSKQLVIVVADAAGEAVASVASLVGRPASPEQVRGASAQDGLLTVEWREGRLVTATDAPAAQVWRHEPGGAPDAGAAREAATEALAAIQAFLARPDSSPGDRLAIITEGAVSTAEGEAPDPAAAAIWGLVRSAQAEHPGSFVLIDSDGGDAAEAALPAALAQDSEPQIALREGTALVPRAIRLRLEGIGPALDPQRTVLITGATGTLGGLAAERLVKEHGARHLLLVSRSGENAPGAAELRAVLAEQGAEVEIAACDVAERDALEALLAAIPAERPLGAVFHAAGALDDATIESLTAERLDPVFAPKADAAWALHELTAEAELTHFVCFSSAAGTLGGPGQGNYAAANAYLDALAQRRRAAGLPATSIAWGYWETESELTAKLTEADLERMRRGGIAPLADAEALPLLDQALGAKRPDVLAVALEPSGLRQMASLGVLPPLLGELIRVPKRRAGAGGSLARKLAELPEAQREAHVLEVVRGEAAAVLGHDSAAAIEPRRAFQELGFDSLAALELRNRLGLATGVRLAPTIVFDHPSAEALATHLLAEVTASGLPRAAVVRSQATEEPIAIVGMSCRLPGGVASPEELWELLAEGRDAIEPFPADRGWDLERLYDSDPDNLTASYATEGGFLGDAAGFDSEFFGIAPREALVIDPQQRLLLEGAWEALEDAGIDPSTLRGMPAGVFAGVMYQDYGAPQFGVAPGMTTSTVSGRLAYTLGLEGPAMTIDTACSSSLVAMHLAAQALRAGECELALAGGVSVLATPSVFAIFSTQRGLAPDGRCKPFAEAADGAGFSEGIGVLVLERLSDAEAKGHSVLATIRGSAVNQDGATNGFTAPNGPSQERVIRQALANASLEPGDVDLLEAHGTGTTLGDPIEAGALLATYGQDREAPLRLGSLKSNVGHTQAAAGVGGVIKAVLAMREGVMPKTLHVDAPSSKVDWEAGRIELLTEAAEWEANGRPRRAAVSSFGASGTNAHLILEQGPEPEPVEAQEGEGRVRPLTGAVPLALSAKSEQALRESAARLATHLREHPEQELLDTAYSLARTRSAFEHRAVAVGTERQQLLASLQAIASGAPGEGASGAPYAVIDHIRRTASERRPVFAFGGQGSQHPQMALGLTQASPVFARSIAECEAALAPHVDWSLTEVLEEEEGKWMERLDIVQPALFATMVSLARLWEASGVRPSLVIGHSQGEVAAAHIAGALCLEDAARVIALRSAAMAKIAGKGAMASVSLPLAELEELLAPYGERLSLAAANGPRAQAVSGEPEAIAELLEACEGQGVRARRIAVDYAAHSAQIEQLEEELLEAFAPISPQSSEIPLHSTLTGELLDTAQMDASYWYRNLRETVLFEPVIEALLEQGRSHFIEISPHPVLSFGIAEAIEAKESPAHLLDTLRRDEDPATRFCLSLAEAHAAGAQVDWEDFFAGSGARKVPLPTYPFQRKRYWLSPGGASGDPSSLGLADAEHPLLGAALSVASGEELLFTGRISLATHPWLADHAVAGTALLPGTGLLELALRAGQELGMEQVRELTMQAPLVLPETGAVQVQVAVGEPGEGGERPIEIHSRPEAPLEQQQPWALNAEGLLAPEAPEAPPALDAWPPEGAEPLEATFLYDHLAEAGYEYGPAFQNLTRAWRRGEDVFAELALAEQQAGEAGAFAVHPALLDAALHAIPLGASQGGAEAAPSLPFSWGEVAVRAPGASALRVALASGGEGRVSLTLAAEDGAAAVQVGSLALRPLAPEQLRAARDRREGLLRVEWRERDLAPAEAGAPVELWRHEPEAGAGSPAAARAAACAALAALQAWLAREDGSPDERFAVLTRNAFAVAEGEAPDPAAAAVWGLVRSAQAEHPGSFLLLDSDGSAASEAKLEAALAQAEEPQLALREGAAFAPRATRVAPQAETEAEAQAGSSPPIDPERTVLITGATGTLGGLAAKHLLTAHGARHLLLVSRSGPEAPGAAELRAELEEQGAEVEIAACDVAERDALEALLAAIPAERPLGAVFHAAGALDDATIESLTAERLDPVFAPKADAAWALHELTAEAELTHFVCFSSAAGTLGGPGQGNYAAANAYLDALAQRRRAAGLPATSIAWGYWETESELTAKLTEADLERMRRGGIAPLADAEALPLFDQALGAKRPDVLAVALEPSGLRQMASLGVLPPLLGELIRVPKRRAGAGGSLARKLAELPEAQREAHVLEVVRGEAAAVLGHDSAAAIEPRRAFQELGFDSLAALELRNRLGLATGVRLAPTIVFDHPSAEALATHLLAEVTASGLPRAAVVRSQATEEPIAIVGMSCRLPGGVASPEELWELLAEGRDAIEPFPADRGWDLERLYDSDPDNLTASYATEGGFLGDAAGFDSEFFGIAPREALVIDPQQRLLLEGAWEALEDAGIDPSTLRGMPAGVFAGVMYQDYGAPQFGVAPGMTTSTVSGRLAYTLGLEGPAMTIDTACSSSLVAMHLAAQALRAGECELALAGGVSVLATPSVFAIFSTQRGLAPDGRCKPFAEAADGAGFSEGIGVLVLERLSDAEAKGHSVLATIRGSAVNQDGATNGFTAPNGPSQERVIRQALANASLEPGDVDLLEAHGTGTTLGDPIEAGALLATYGQDREAPLRLGSLKSNVGHTQAAAGVGGVIKAVLAMREGVMPKTLHVDEPSSKVDWEAGQVELLTEAAEWEANGRQRRAAVSSFGASGTNAHLILEQGPEPEPVEAQEGEAPTPPLTGPVPLALSAKSEQALRESAARLATHLQANPEQELLDTAYSLTATRSAFEHRAVAVGTERQQLLDSLQAIASGAPGEGASGAPYAVIDRIRRTATERRPVFAFGGQGSQHPQMALGLTQASPVFARSIAECEAALAPHVDWSLTEVLEEEEGKWMERLDIVQPALFATMVSLARLWEASGVRPSLVIGHSQGEVAAAHIAGALCLEDAARVIALRSKAMAKIAGKGAMASVSLPLAELEELLAPYGERLSLAAANGPRTQAVSGEPEAIAELLEACEGQGVRARRIAVDYAAHSAQIEQLEEELLEAFAPISPQSSEIPLHSTLTGELLDTARMDASYWYRNLRETVLFEPVIEALLQQGRSHFIEISPHPVLSFGIAEAIEASESPARVLDTLRRDEDPATRFCLSLAEAHAAGAQVDWEDFFAGSGARKVPLPTYPFQRERYWLSPTGASGDPSSLGLADAEHPLLGALVEGPSGEGLVLTGRISLATHPWLADHAVAGTVLFPGTAFLELALQAAERVDCALVRELTLSTPLVLSERDATQLRVSVGPGGEEGERKIAIHSRPGAGEGEASEWTLNAEGVLAADATEPEPPPESDAWPPDGAEQLDAELLYDRLAEIGFAYGPAFQGLSRAWRRGDELFAEVDLADVEAEDAERFAVHPALLDSALHAILLSALGGDGPRGPMLPFSWSDAAVGLTGVESLRVALTSHDELRVSLRAWSSDGAPVARVGALAMRPVSLEQLEAGSSAGSTGLLGIEWREWAPAGATGAAPARAWRAARDEDQAPLIAARRAAGDALNAIQEFLAGGEDSAGERLAIVTEGAVAAVRDEAPDPAAAAIWGLARSAQTEHPGRILLVDTDGGDESEAILPAALAQAEEPQLALRDGVAFVPRATPLPAAGDSLMPPAAPWRLDAGRRTGVEDLTIVPNPDAGAPLGPTQVRVEVRASGLNFRDVVVVLGFEVPGEAALGSEAAGVVLEAGEEVGDLKPGDRVMGLLGGAFASTAIADRELLVPVPEEWSFVQAAAVPAVFATALYGLEDLAKLRSGERLLVHAGAGGVGMAAIGIANGLGAEVFATASPSKWDALRELGIAEERIASSRDLEFRETFLAETGGEGVDVVLNSLSGEFVDASLALLPRGGRFLEMGKTDIRDAEVVAAAHPGVAYRAFDLGEAGIARMAEMLADVVGRIARAELRHSPVRAWDLRRAREAFRHLREGRNVGKVVLEAPRPIDPGRTVLITGGTGGLGALTARHLVAVHGARHLLVVSRSGAQAPGAGELREAIEELGAEATIAACDVSDRAQLEGLLASIPAERPLGAVFHAAGALDDATIDSLTPERIDAVFGPKADAAWHLHELTRDAELSHFVVYSSVAGALGGPGQGNYAAANAFCDALAQRRRAEGLPASSIAWGYWDAESALTAKLGEADLERLRRAGIAPLSSDRGLACLDQALLAERPDSLAVAVDSAGLRSMASLDILPPVLSDLVRVRRKRSGSAGALARKLASLPEDERSAATLEAVKAEVATVLGHPSGSAIEAERPFQDLGFDSLAAVELRNRLGNVSGVRLAATVVFDYPNAAALAEHVHSRIASPAASGESAADALDRQLGRLEALLTGVEDGGERERAATRLRGLLAAVEPDSEDGDLAEATDEEMFELLDRKLGQV